MTYFRAIGLGVSVIIFIMAAGYQGLSLFSSIWLSQWTDDDLLANRSLANTSAYQNQNSMYLGVYGGLGVGQGGFCSNFSVTCGFHPACPTPFYSVLVSVSCLYSPFTCISFHKFSRQLFAFSLCSSHLISALWVLSTIIYISL